MLIRPLQPKRPYEIHFARGQERVLDHLVAHEVGHVVRLHQVPEEERLFAVAMAENRRRAAHQIAPEMVARLGRTVPQELLPDLFDLWFRGVCTQLTSFPADLRIEQWIHDRFAGIREIQRRSLIHEVHRSFPGFAPEVIALTPPTIFRATMTMNAAQAYHVAELYALPELMLPFDVNEYAVVGTHLAQMVFDAPDEGHRSDMAATSAWAEEVNLVGWIDWQNPSGGRCLGVEVGTR